MKKYAAIIDLQATPSLKTPSDSKSPAARRAGSIPAPGTIDFLLQNRLLLPLLHQPVGITMPSVHSLQQTLPISAHSSRWKCRQQSVAANHKRKLGSASYTSASMASRVEMRRGIPGAFKCCLTFSRRRTCAWVGMLECSWKQNCNHREPAPPRRVHGAQTLRTRKKPHTLNDRCERSRDEVTHCSGLRPSFPNS